MSTSLKKYFPAGTPVKWSASAKKFFPSSGEIILNDDTTLNIKLKQNFSYDYWVVVEASSDVERVSYFEVHTKNYGTLSLMNLPEIGDSFFGIRKSDYPDLQWDYIIHDYHNGTISKPMSYSTFKQMQIDFGNQEFTTKLFPVRTISKGGSMVTYPYAILYFDDLYVFGGDGIQGYNGIVYLRANTIKIFSKVPSDVKFSVDESGSSRASSTRYLYVQNPTGFTTAASMFSGLGSCSVNIEDFDFSNINDVSFMFNSVYFKDIDSYPLFDTSHITDMSYMFSNTLEATGLLNNIPLYDTSNVTDMHGMFSGRRIDVVLPNFNTSKVTTMNYMFEGSTINTTLPNWDTSNVTSMNSMFRDATINTVLPNWDVSNVTDMRNMFDGMTIDFDLPNWNISNVTDVRWMFDGATINTILPDWNISNMSYMFCRSTINSTLPNWDMSNVTNMSGMFSDATINSEFPNWDTSNVTDMSFMFDDTDITSFPNWNTSNVTNMWAMFYLCGNINNIRIDMNACTNAGRMFDGCSSLSDLYISNLKTSIDLSDCPLTYDSTAFIINNLQRVKGNTITFGSSISNYLTHVATEKGWTVAVAEQSTNEP